MTDAGNSFGREAVFLEAIVGPQERSDNRYGEQKEATSSKRSVL